MTLEPLAKEMLIAAYTRQFGKGQQLDWQAWAEEAGRDRQAVARTLDQLQDRYLLMAGGGRLTVLTSGAELVERGSLADARLLARQFNLRRSALNYLNGCWAEQRRDERPEAGAIDALPIASAVGEPWGPVLKALVVLRDCSLVEHGTAGNSLFRISSRGRDALAMGQMAWPLSGS
jgi:hypothetical protein